MPWKKTKQRAATAKRQGKSASTQAGAYVREQMDKLKKGKGRAKSRKQAIAIGLSEAREEGVKVKRKKSTAKKPGPKKSGGRKKT